MKPVGKSLYSGKTTRWFRLRNLERGGPRAHLFVYLGFHPEPWRPETVSKAVQERRIAEMIEPSLAAMGYELVRVRMGGPGGGTGGGSGSILQVMAERLDRAGMTVEDCADISRALSAALDVDDPIEGAYELEVSSPGLDRPLVRPADFERFAGYEAKVEMRAPVDGRRRLRGRILGLAGDRVRMDIADGGGETEFAFAAIEKAKLIMTDELIAGDLHGTKA